MKRVALALALLLSACASDDQTPVSVTPTAAPPAAPQPPPVAVAPALPLPPPDQCGAYELQDLVGKPRQSIPVPVDPSRRRVVCTTCPITMDFSPERLTIYYDAESGLVTKLQCQ